MRSVYLQVLSFSAGMQDVTQSDILKKLDEPPLPLNTKSILGGLLVNTEESDDYGMMVLSYRSVHMYFLFVIFYLLKGS